MSFQYQIPAVQLKSTERIVSVVTRRGFRRRIVAKFNYLQDQIEFNKKCWTIISPLKNASVISSHRRSRSDAKVSRNTW